MSQEVVTKFCYNGAEYEFDIRDADESEKFENAIARMGEEEKLVGKAGKSSELTRGQCKLIKDFFDRTLGEGAGTALCTERNNIATCYDAYDAFLAVVRSQKDDIIRRKNAFSSHSNRQQRRHPEAQK